MAETLRTRFCGGEAAVLLRDDMKARVYLAFASLEPRGPKRDEQMYVRWVQKLASKEYADELVVLCVALELGIRIKIIPYTPPTVLDQWAVATYGREDTEHVLHLGNNDAHYVYLSQDSTQDSTEVVATPERHSKDTGRRSASAKSGA